MAVDPNLLVIKKVSDLETNNDPQYLLTANSGDNMVKTDYSILRDSIISGVKGEATPSSSPTAWAPGDPPLFEKWDVKTAGTYTNFLDESNNPIVVTSGNLVGNIVQIWVTNGVSKLEVLSLPAASQNIADFEDLTFPAPSGTQTIYNDIYWQVASDQTATISDIPSDDSTVWARIGDAVLNKSTFITPIKTDTYTTNSYFINTNIFTGFGFNYGIIKDFNQVVIKVGQIVGTSNPVTEVNIKIREVSYTGNQLATMTKTVAITEGEIQDVIFNLPDIIANTGNANIWIEFWCNGKTGLFKGSTGIVAYRYKTTAQSYTDFATQSTASGANNSPFYLLLNKVVNTSTFKPELIADEVLIDDDRPVKSSAVAERVAGYDEVIVDGFNIDTEIISGNENINVQNSTFKGWGQLKGVLSNFNRVGYIVRAFDAALIPTTVRCIIRKTSNSGAIIFDQTKNVSLVLNVNKKVYFDLPTEFINTDGDEIYISFLANGMIALIGGAVGSDFDSAHAVKYTTNATVEVFPSTVSNLKYQMYADILKGVPAKQVSESESNRIAKIASGFDSPDFVLTSRAWLFPGFQYNIYDENVCVPKYGDNNSNYRLNYDGGVGKQTSRGFRFDPITASLTSTLNVTLSKGRNSLAVKSQSLLSAATTSGTGINRKVLIIGDSTVNGSNISTPLKAVFDADIMDITLIGTLGAAGVKHEGRGGWRISDYYGQGTVLYQINVTGVSVPPGIGARYTQGANTYNVEEVNMTGGAGYFSVSIVTGSAPTASGTLTKTTGTGDASIVYASSSQTSANPFYNPSTLMFDIGYYLTNTSQSLASNDWIFFQLGINDVFSYTDIPTAEAKVATMVTQLNAIIANIHAYNANIRIGLVVTFPPADQNAFGESYSVGQLSEMYRKTGLITWQNKMLSEYDNTTTVNNKTYLVAAHLNLDVRNNFQTTTRAVNSRNTNTETVQSNGVHPAASGYAQISDMYAGLIKYFA